MRHARPTVIAVAVTCGEDRTVIAVSDDGVGFDAEATESGRGLFGMRRRAESLGGILRVLPRNGGGTCVMLELPAAARGSVALGSATAGAS